MPLAGSYTTGAQQQSRLTSAWYRLPAPDDGHPLVVVTAAGKIAGNSVLHHHTDGQTVVLEYGRPGPGGDIVPAGRLVPYDLYGSSPRPGATCASPAPTCPRTPWPCGWWPRTCR